jgi:hypothetical protein
MRQGVHKLHCGRNRDPICEPLLICVVVVVVWEYNRYEFCLRSALCGVLLAVQLGVCPVLLLLLPNCQICPMYRPYV